MALSAVKRFSKGLFGPGRILLAAFFSFAMVFGAAFDEQGACTQLFSSTGQTAATLAELAALLALGLLLQQVLFGAADALRSRPGKKKRACAGALGKLAALQEAPAIAAARTAVRFVFEEHPFGGTWVLLFVCYLPAIIGFAPGLFMGDTVYMLEGWFNVENWHSSHIVLLDPNILLTQHHPVLYNALLGALVQAGQALTGSSNAGIYVMTALQVALVLSILAYSFSVLARMRVRVGLRVALAVLLVAMPLYGDYLMLVTKDSPFAFGVLLLCMCLALFGSGRGRRKDWAVAFGAALLVTFTRNGGWLFAAGGLVVLAVICRGRKRAAAAGMAVACFALSFALSNVLLPSLGISPSSTREVLSVPFQQTARYLVEHPNDVTDEEREAIDAVLGFDGLADSYYALMSDPVKDRYNKYTTSSQLKAYFAAWASMGLRHPDSYAFATMNNYYGYFFPGYRSANIYSYGWSQYKMQCVNEEGGFNFSTAGNPLSDWLGPVCGAYLEGFCAVPVLNIVAKPALYCWLLLLLISYCVKRRIRMQYAPLVVCTLVLLVCFIGPCNANIYARYAFPIMAATPFMLCLLFTKKPGRAQRTLKRRRGKRAR